MRMLARGWRELLWGGRLGTMTGPLGVFLGFVAPLGGCDFAILLLRGTLLFAKETS